MTAKKWPVTRADDHDGCEWVQCGTCNATDYHADGCTRITWYEEHTPTDNAAERARLVARVLRKSGIRAMAFLADDPHVSIGDWEYTGEFVVRHSWAMSRSCYEAISPISIAASIRGDEAKNASRLAGD